MNLGDGRSFRSTPQLKCLARNGLLPRTPVIDRPIGKMNPYLELNRGVVWHANATDGYEGSESGKLADSFSVAQFDSSQKPFVAFRHGIPMCPQSRFHSNLHMPIKKRHDCGAAFNCDDNGVQGNGHPDDDCRFECALTPALQSTTSRTIDALRTS